MNTKMKIAINQILGVSISSYRGPLDIGDVITDSLREDLKDCTDKDGNIKTEKGDILNLTDLDADFVFKKNYLESQAKILGDSLDLKCLEKYGITVKGFDIRKPRYYNNDDDCLDMEFDISYGDWRKEYPELIEHVQYYIDNVRQKSRDGYMSYEPDKAENVNKDDYAYIWAILHKEDMLDNNKARLQEGIIDILDNDWEFIEDTYYTNYKTGEKYKLYYDSKVLSIIE